jgi:hypothetical protein
LARVGSALVDFCLAKITGPATGTGASEGVDGIVAGTAVETRIGSALEGRNITEGKKQMKQTIGYAGNTESKGNNTTNTNRN